MMNTRTLLLSLGALFATLSPLPAATHMVENGGDDFQNPQPGSLRHAIEVLAQPGDTVKFASPIVVTLVDKLEVDPALTGLRIEGPGQIRRLGTSRRGVLSIDASGVTLANVMFSGVHVTVGGEGIPLTGFTIQGCEFSSFGSLSVIDTQGTRIEQNKFFVAGNRDEEPAITLTDSDDVVVANNLIEVRHLTGLQASRGGNLTVRDNVSNAPFSIVLRSGRVTGNTVMRRSMSVYQEDQDGPIVVNDNTCGSLRVTGVDLSVRRNTVQANLLLKTNYGTPRNARVDEDATPGTALGVYVGLLNGDDPYDGPVFVEDNDITGGLTGLAFSQRVATPQTSVLGNEVRRASLKGMSLSVTVPALVAGNFIEDCTGTARGPRAALAVHQGTEDLLIESNTLNGNRCNGVVISAGATATVKGNTIRNGTRPGIVIAGGADIVAENNTIEACKRGGIFLDPSSAATLTGNTIKTTAGPGIVVSTGAVLTATNSTVEENVGPGIRFQPSSKGTVTGGAIRNNRGAGVYILKLAEADLRGATFGGNLGAGIDITPAGITANALPKRGNGGIDFPDELEFDGAMRKIRGEAEVGAVVQLFRSEPGAQTGRRRNGEGVMLVGETVADGNGMFAISPGPAQEGDLFCLTATRLGTQPVTSEFSENIAVTPTAPIERVNVSSSGEEANGGVLGESLPSISDNGRFVVFTSMATNHVADDTNEGLDVFVRDVMNGTTTRVSVNSAGEQAAASGTTPYAASASISADGNFVVFRTSAENFVSGTSPSSFSSGWIALHDRTTGATTGVTDPAFEDTMRPVSSQRRGQGYDPAISADGNAVAFISTDGAFVPEDTNGSPDIFVWTRSSGAYERVSVTSAGGQVSSGLSTYQDPRLSGDGSLVVFTSFSALVPSGISDGIVYLRDRTAGTTEIVSRATGADGAVAAAHSPSISRDGRFVAFVTNAALVAEDTNGAADVYVRDRTNQTTELCSRKPDGSLPGNAQTPALSGDGRYVAFVAPGQSDSGGFIVLHPDLFVLDRQTGTVVEAGIGISGEAFGSSLRPSLSNDGRFLTFESDAANLVENDMNEVIDLFLRDRAAELAEP